MYTIRDNDLYSGGWQPMSSDGNQWIQVYFGGPARITGMCFIGIFIDKDLQFK